MKPVRHKHKHSNSLSTPPPPLPATTKHASASSAPPNGGAGRTTCRPPTAVESPRVPQLALLCVPQFACPHSHRGFATEFVVVERILPGF